MKIAISGKGGVGKSTVAAAIALTLAGRGQRVLALDADPDANLAAALGIPSSVAINPISRELDLIEERTGVKLEGYSKVFKLNPEVSDVAERFAVRHRGVELVVLGAIRNGGGGCACAESTFIQALVNDLVLYKDETLVMDMEAGIEHLGRATATGVDVMIAVMEPGQRAVDCARSVLRLSEEIGLTRFVLVGNKVTAPADEQFLRDAFPGRVFAAFLPYAEHIRRADRDGVSVLDAFGPVELAAAADIISAAEAFGEEKHS
ncbi:MAG: AAA family ATPase [Oscillospiraceae bacterium]|jgi:CO dehydrogenase maturation factor|nr:AAA family ATPase [Oscillospiraceae bacterium]